MDSVCFVSNTAWSVFNFRLDVVRYLLRKGYRVLVFAAPDGFETALEKEGCAFIPLAFDNRSLSILADVKLYRQLKRLYRQHQPGVIFHYVVKPNVYGTLAAAALAIPSIAVVTGLGYSFSKRGWLYRLTKLLYAYALKRSREVWFLNNEDAQFFIAHKLVDVNRTRIIHGEGIHTGYFQLPATAQQGPVFCFLMSARLLRSKGIVLFAEAARMLRRKQYAARFVLIGSPEETHPDALDPALLRGWQQEGLIDYQGFVADVRPALSAANCFVFPSYYNEGVPRSLMEAASMQVPIITTFNRGCREVVVDGQTGFLCRPKDAVDLAGKMEMMINLPVETRKAMGAAGRELVTAKFDVQEVAERYERTIQSALAKNLPAADITR